MRRCVFVSHVEYKKGIRTIENYVDEYVIGMKGKINECRSFAGKSDAKNPVGNPIL